MGLTFPLIAVASSYFPCQHALMNFIPLLLVILTVVATIGLGIYATRIAKTASDFFVAGRSVNVFWNASAISGEYLSAASFMGVAGMVMKFGYDTLWYPVGYATGYLLLLLFIAGPLRRFGAYTIPDFAEGRFDSPTFRKIAVTFVLFIGFFYTMPQMKGAGITMQQIMDWPYWLGVTVVGSVITFNVAMGGMKGITFVQAFQYWAKMFAIAAPMFILMSVYGGYHKNLGQNLAEPGKTPVLTEEKTFKYKGREAYPANVITFSSAQDTTFTFAKVGAIIRKLLPGEEITQPLLIPPLESHYKGIGKLRQGNTQEPLPPLALPIYEPGEQLTAHVVTVTRNGQPVIENGKVVKTGAKIELYEPTEITYPAGTIVPNCPANSQWIQPFGALTGKYGYPLLYTYSLIIAIICGTAGLPHILVRFYTNPDGRSAKRTTLWVMVLIGTFYLFPPMWGALGRNVMPALYANGLTDRVVIALPTVFVGAKQFASPLLGQILSGITSAGAFAAFMSTFSGLLVSMSGALAHDIYGNILRPGASPTSRLKAFKVSAILIGAGAMGLGLLVETFDINMMVGWAFAIGAASYFPLLLMGSWWRGLTKYGAGVGMLSGGLFSLAAIVCAMLLDKGVLALPLNPIVRTLLEQPAIWGVPLALLTMFIVSNLTRQHVPSDVDLKMLRLHAPEELGVSKDYITH